MTEPLKTQEDLLKRAGIAGEVWAALHGQNLPEQLCTDLTYDWLMLREGEDE